MVGNRRAISPDAREGRGEPRCGTAPLLFAFAAIVAALGTRSLAAQQVRSVEAVAGEPFGVAKVSLRMPAQLDDRILISEPTGRVLYPTVTQGSVRRLFNGLLGGESAPQRGTVNIHFLFRGDEPLELTVRAPRPVSVVVVPRMTGPLGHRVRLQSWWRHYRNGMSRQLKAGDYPPLVETYLVGMLARRLNLELPAEDAPEANRLTHTVHLVTGSETLHLAAMRNMLRGDAPPAGPLVETLPAEITWQQPDIEVPEDVPVEPISMHVPPDCFYLRFDKFSDFLWLMHLTEDYDGDLKNMLGPRAAVRDTSKRLEKQLALRYSFLADLLGDQAVADMAIIGRDTFVDEGAAIGVVLEVRNQFLLETAIQQERSSAQKRAADLGAKLETLQIGGREVSLISTADHAIRSFYASAGKYRLISNSRSIVEKFLAIADGETALGATSEFRHARTQMPLDREDSLFAYFSPAFFRGLVGLQYEVELHRRLQARNELELLQLARLASRGEGHDDHSIPALIRHGFLPPGFGHRPDGSELVEVAEGRWQDRLRGTPGTFLPIADVPIGKLTAAEAERFRQHADFYSNTWRAMDPLMIGMKRFALAKDRERIVVEASISPLLEEKYGWILSLLGAPAKTEVSAAPGDLVNVQASLRGGILFPNVPPHHLFLRIQDREPGELAAPDGLLGTYRWLTGVPGYLGAWPKPGFLDMLPIIGDLPNDGDGFSQLPLGVWRRQGGGFSVLSFNRQLLEQVTPHLHDTESLRASQLRVHIGNLADSRLAPWIRNLEYEQTCHLTRATLQLLDTLSNQLLVPTEQALPMAEQLLRVKLRCSTGGEFKLVARDGLSRWEASCGPLSQSVTHALPENYQSTLLGWFRGAEAELLKEDRRIVLRARVDVQQEPQGFSLPLLGK